MKKKLLSVLLSCLLFFSTGSICYADDTMSMPTSSTTKYLNFVEEVGAITSTYKIYVQSPSTVKVGTVENKDSYLSMGYIKIILDNDAFKVPESINAVFEAPIYDNEYIKEADIGIENKYTSADDVNEVYYMNKYDVSQHDFFKDLYSKVKDGTISSSVVSINVYDLAHYNRQANMSTVVTANIPNLSYPNNPFTLLTTNTEITDVDGYVLHYDPLSSKTYKDTGLKTMEWGELDLLRAQGYDLDKLSIDDYTTVATLYDYLQTCKSYILTGNYTFNEDDEIYYDDSYWTEADELLPVVEEDLTNILETVKIDKTSDRMTDINTIYYTLRTDLVKGAPGAAYNVTIPVTVVSE